NSYKLHDSSYSVEELVRAGVLNARAAGDGVVALDVGPTGKLIKPLGDISFEDAYNAFSDMMRAGAAAGADMIHIETMSDTHELKAAVLAAKENTNLPVFATVVFDERGKLLTGADVRAVVTLLEGLRVDAIGINCGLGPIQMKPLLAEMLACASVPIIAKPNAGLPKSVCGKTVYDVSVDEFASELRAMAEMGVWAVGGCCGTTPAHIAAMVSACKDVVPCPIQSAGETVVSSYAKTVKIGEKPVIIGERINPTGKSRFKEALRTGDMDYILREGLTQVSAGAHILDVNVGLPGIDEAEMMTRVVEELQGIIDVPLQIDTADTEALERALRTYNGKAMVNSVNGKEESMSAVFPLIKKYGGVVVGLTLDEKGIPNSVSGRVAIAERIVKEAAKYGIDKKDIVIDALCMTISSDAKSAEVTLETIKEVQKKLGVKTVLGVSNISFGLPKRENINAAFYTMALNNGLSCGIINPNSEAMMRAYSSFCALSGSDENCLNYIERYSGQEAPVAQTGEEMTLGSAVEHGMADAARRAAGAMCKSTPPLEIISGELVPALDRVGAGFETGKLFLPQLLMSAEAAKAAFEVLRECMSASGEEAEKKEPIILATVKGDIHDIGKNIVKVLLENYGFDVIDLGKDVEPKKIVAATLERSVRLVGLSALMTTTVPSMAETIRVLHAKAPGCKVMVGGAVLSAEYAKEIGADHYGRDAMSSVNFAQEILG
ncbi:MAG: homocysteine S-methyltransferase family protein, partial [Clostridia bacterium]